MYKKTILVNGMLYDAITGMPIKKQANSRASTAPEKRHTKSSHQVHRRLEQSKSHARKAPSAPLIQKRAEPKISIQPAAQRSHIITKFAHHPKPTGKPNQTVDGIRPASPHPLSKKVEARMQQAHPNHAPTATPVKPSSIIKKEAIDEALNKATAHHSAAKHIKHPKRASRMLSFASFALSLLLLTGYLTYINLPNLSVRVAANQAGIEASYPGYRPDGYRLAGVNYDQGSVSLDFAANAGPQNFTITQQQTSWDSSAVKENYVKTNWGDNVIPYSERGLTIYAHEGNAAWVNGGILYTITGDATLSTTQVRSIATSL